MGDHGPWCSAHGNETPCEQCAADEAARVVDEHVREQTAATILAALLPEAIRANPTQHVAGIVARAVVLTDALRAELAK